MTKIFSTLITVPEFGLSLCVVLCIALVGCAYFYFSRRSELRRGPEGQAGIEPLSERLSELSAELSRLYARIEVLEKSEQPVEDAFQDSASINLNCRGQVLRLHRRGDSAPEIASALGLSQGEVKLIVKVHNLALFGQRHDFVSKSSLVPSGDLR